MQVKILVVEDEQSLLEIITNDLVKSNYKVDVSSDGLDAYNKIIDNNYDLIILDVMLPNLDGFEILNKIREENIDSKVIMLTARSTLEDKLNGLQNGANDYVTKPFHMEELLARVNIQLKQNNNNYIKFQDLILDLNSSKLKCVTSGEEVELVCKEYELLEYFFNNPNQILTKDQIYDKIWGIDSEIESNNLEVYLSFIRKKLKAISSKVNIKSVRNLGYKLEVEDEKITK